MATTGAKLWLYTQGLIDKDYSDFVGNAKANRFFEVATYNAIDKSVEMLNTKKVYDELSYFIVTKQPVSGISNNRIPKLPIQITTMAVTGGGVLATITTSVPHNYTVGDIVQVKGFSFAGFTVANRTVYQVLSPYIFTIQVSGWTDNPSYPNQGYTYGTNQLVDYLHLLAVEVDTKDIKLPSTYITGATNASPIVLSLNRKSILRSGSHVTVTGVNGNTAANTTCYLKQLSDTRFEMYSDEDLTIPIAGSGAFTTSTSSAIRMIYSSFCYPYDSITKISAFGDPNPMDPAYEDTQQALVIYPLNRQVLSAQIDYVKKPDILIDVADTTLDLELIYGNKFLYRIADEFCSLYSMAVKDETLYRTIMNDEVKNP